MRTADEWTSFNEAISTKSNISFIEILTNLARIRVKKSDIDVHQMSIDVIQNPLVWFHLYRFYNIIIVYSSYTKQDSSFLLISFDMVHNNDTNWIDVKLRFHFELHAELIHFHSGNMLAKRLSTSK